MTKIIHFNTVNFYDATPTRYRECSHIGITRESSDKIIQKLPRMRICRNLLLFPRIFRQPYQEITEKTYLWELVIVSEKIPTTLPKICRESIFVGKFLQIPDEFENFTPFSRLVVGDFPRTWVIGPFRRSRLRFLVVH